jgi:hypothetical protein
MTNQVPGSNSTAPRSALWQYAREVLANKLTCETLNKRMLDSKGPARPSLTLGDAFNAG